MEEQYFKSCCGKRICDGCNVSMMKEEVRKGKKKEEIGMCAFCRTLRPSSNEMEIERIQKLMGSGNADAFYTFVGNCAEGVTDCNKIW